MIFSFAFGLIACTIFGVPGTTLLADLTDEDAVSLCQEAGAEREYECEADGVSYTITYGYENVEDCDDEEAPNFPDDCEATVDDWRACSDATEAALTEDACHAEEVDECEAVYKCLGA